MKREERDRRPARFVRVAGCAAFLVVLAASSRAAGFPAFKDQCPASQIDRPCATQEGVSGTCIAAECRQSVDPQTDPFVDANTTTACTPCAICEPPGPFQLCTDTIACAPGFTCFSYGVEPLATAGPEANPIQFGVWGSIDSCLEAGAGPLFASGWSPCDGGGEPVGNPSGSSPGAGSGSGAAAGARSNSGAAVGGGSSGGGAVLDAGAASFAPTGATTSVDASVSENGEARAPTNRDADLDLSRGGCEVGAGAAANGIPLMGVIFFWIARRYRTRRS